MAVQVIALGTERRRRTEPFTVGEMPHHVVEDAEVVSVALHLVVAEHREVREVREHGDAYGYA